MVQQFFFLKKELDAESLFDIMKLTSQSDSH